MGTEGSKDNGSFLSDYKYLWVVLGMLILALCYRYMMFAEPKYKAGECVMQLLIRYYVLGYDNGTYNIVNYRTLKGDLIDYSKPILVSKESLETWSGVISCPKGLR